MVLVQVVIGDKLVGQQKPEKIKNIRLVFPVHSTSPSYNRGAVWGSRYCSIRLHITQSVLMVL